MINFNLKQNAYDKYLPYLFGTLLLIGASILGWWGYRLYLDKIEQSAFRDLSESIEAFDKFMTSVDKQSVGGDKLEDLERAFIVGAQKYSKSKLIPFFHLYKADILIQKGDFSGALGALDNAIDKVEKDSPFYYLFLTKKALLQSDNDLSKEQGLKELNELAVNKNNPFAPMAAYYLGLYYYQLGKDKENIDKAKSIWKEALDRQERLTKASECSWCEIIRSKLKTIS